MTETAQAAKTTASGEEIRNDPVVALTSRVAQLETEWTALQQENKTLRSLLERVIEHRQKSHGELVLLITGLVSKLPINDVGTLVARLVEHNNHVNEVLAALVKGTAEADLPQPAVLKELDETRRDLLKAVKPAVDELIQLEAPLEHDVLQSLATDPEQFFSQRVARANRCYVKGQLPRERIVKEFGEPALEFFIDMTTDPKLNPRPKAEEIALGFKSDFEKLLAAGTALPADKRAALQALHRKVQQSKAAATGRAQKNAFQRLSFVIELLHYYDHQATEAPDVTFAQRLPALVEQLVVASPQDSLDEKLIAQAENLMAFVINPDHRAMIINNVGKGGGIARTLKFVFKLRAEKLSDPDEVLTEFCKHLVSPPPEPPPAAGTIAAVLRLLNPERQRMVILALMESDRMSRGDAQALGKAIGKQLGLTGLDAPKKAPENIPAEVERQMAWERIKDLILRRNDPMAIASAIRDRLHSKYDADELRQSWITLIEAEPIALIRVFCQIPYRPDGKTDSIARTVMETYVSRLTHEKYTATYTKVVNSLRSTFHANPNSPTLMNFMALVRWVDPQAAARLCADIGMHAQ